MFLKLKTFKSQFFTLFLLRDLDRSCFLPWHNKRGFFLFLVTALRYNSHAIKFTCHKIHPYEMFSSLVFSILAKLCSHCYYLFLKHFLSSRKETLYPLAFCSSPFSPQPLTTTDLSVSMDLPIADISCRWSYSACGFLWLAFFT